MTFKWKSRKKWKEEKSTWSDAYYHDLKDRAILHDELNGLQWEAALL